jgi:hypothetical protein
MPQRAFFPACHHDPADIPEQADPESDIVTAAK